METKTNTVTYILSISLLSLFVILGQPLAASGQMAVGPGEGVSFNQVNFDYETPVLDSDMGFLVVDIPTLQQSTEMNAGYLNVDINGAWVVQNLPILSDAEYPYAAISTYFDLGITSGTDVSSVSASVSFSDAFITAFAPGTPSAFSVGDTDIRIGGANLNDIPPSLSVQSSTPSNVDIAFSPDGNIFHVSQRGHTNIEAAQNQCVPASFANSLQMLENTTALTLVHENVMGLKGDNSLVGKLGTAMNRTVTNRRNGMGLYEAGPTNPAVSGKMKYLLENGLQGRIKTTHQSRYWTDRPTETATVDGKTMTSKRTGNSVSHSNIVDALKKGQDIELTYEWPAHNGINAGAHNVVVVAAGQIGGMRYIVHSSDLNQRDDSKGAGASGLVFEWVADTDGDGHLNFLSDPAVEIRSMVTEEYVPPKTIMFDQLVTLIFGDQTHLCCVNQPGPHASFSLDGDMLTIADSASYFPFTGYVLDGMFSATSKGTIAGWPNVQSTFSGAILDTCAFATCPSVIASNESLERSPMAEEGDILVAQGTIEVGANGALPGGQSISFNVDLTLPGGDTTTISTDTTVETGGTLTIDRYDSLVISAGKTLTVDGILDNDSINTITVESGAVLEVNGIFDNDGTVNNQGTINVNQGAFLDNDGTITNAAGATFDNDGTVTNDVDGTIENDGTIDTAANAFMFNEGAINNDCDGVISGTITGNAAENTCLIPFNIVSIDTDLTAPPAVGANVQITITTTRLQFNPHYRWFANTVPFTAWDTLADWTLFNDRETWSPAAENRYVALGHAAEVGETTNFHQGGFIFETQGSSASPIQILDVTTDIDYPQSVGTPISLSATASGGSGGTLYFKYFYRLRMGAWTEVGPWNEDGEDTWTPQEEGVYTLVVHVSEDNTVASNPLNQAGMTVTIGE